MSDWSTWISAAKWKRQGLYLYVAFFRNTKLEATTAIVMPI